MTRENALKARQAQIPQLVYQNKFYKISTIPLNYRIDIKKSCRLKHPKYGIDRDCYSDPNLGLDYAKKMAEETIQEYFVRQ